MEAYPLFLRRKIIGLYQQGWQTVLIARRFGLSPAGVRRIRQRHRLTGSLEPTKPAVGRKPRIDQAKQEQLRQFVLEHPDATLDQLRNMLGLPGIALSTVCLTLRRMGLTFKKSRSTRASRTAKTSRSSVIVGTMSN